MRTRFTLFFGVFAVMALSNAIVPVLPSFAGSSALQGAIYAAYFLGAFISTLPSGILSDRIGRIPLCIRRFKIDPPSRFKFDPPYQLERYLVL
jgi:MFS family permease